MHLLHVALKNVLRRKTRSALAAMSVASAVAATVALVGFATGFEASMAESYDAHHVDLLVVRTGVAERMTSSLDASLGTQLARLPHVRAVNPSLTDLVSFGEGSLIGIPVRGWPPSSFVWDRLDLAAGQRPTDADHHAILLGSTLASTLHKNVGDTVRVEGAEFRVAGIYRGVNPYDDATAAVVLADLQQLMDRAGQVTEFELMLDSPVDRETIGRLSQTIETLQNPDGQRWGLTAIATRDYVDSSTQVKLARALAWATTAIAMLIGCVAVLNTMSVSVLERTQEIGVLRAIGWRRKRVVLMILCEAQLISAVGVATGLTIALAGMPLLARLPLAAGLIRPTVAPLVVVAAIGLAALVGLVGSAWPSYRSTHLLAAEALTYDSL